MQTGCSDATDKENALSMLTEDVACCFSPDGCGSSDISACIIGCATKHGWTPGNMEQCEEMAMTNTCMETDELALGCNVHDVYQAHVFLIMSMCMTVPACLTTCKPAGYDLADFGEKGSCVDLKAMVDCTTKAGACSASDQEKANVYLDFYAVIFQCEGWNDCLVEASCFPAGQFNPTVLDCEAFNDLQECAGADGCGFNAPIMQNMVQMMYGSMMDDTSNTVLENDCKMPWPLTAEKDEDAGGASSVAASFAAALVGAAAAFVVVA